MIRGHPAAIVLNDPGRRDDLDMGRLRPITDTHTPTRRPTRIPIMDTIQQFPSHLDSMEGTDSVPDSGATGASGGKTLIR